MSLAPKLFLTPLNVSRIAVRSSSVLGELGSGVGKGGSSGGSIRDAGGAFGRLEAAREEEYIYHLQKHQLKELKQQIKRELELHERQMKSHLELVERHKKRYDDLEKEQHGISG